MLKNNLYIGCPEKVNFGTFTNSKMSFNSWGPKWFVFFLWCSIFRGMFSMSFQKKQKILSDRIVLGLMEITAVY